MVKTEVRLPDAVNVNTQDLTSTFFEAKVNLTFNDKCQFIIKADVPIILATPLSVARVIG